MMSCNLRKQAILCLVSLLSHNLSLPFVLQCMVAAVKEIFAGSRGGRSGIRSGSGRVFWIFGYFGIEV